MILDHVGLYVSDLAASRAFYTAALAPLGISVLIEGDGWCMFGSGRQPQFWIGDRGPVPGGIHLAFVAADHAHVQAFHTAAIAAGGQDNGAPGPRDYHPAYYGAFVIGPDGHNIEAVCHVPE